MALDEADKKAIADMIGASLKAAMTPEVLGAAVAPVVDAHVKAATKDAVTPAALKAQLDELAKTLKPAEPGAGGGEGGKGKGGDPDPKIAALEKRLLEQEQATKTAQAAAAAEAERSRTSTLHTKAREALGKAGVPADRLDFAMATLKDKGVLTYDGDRPGWKGKDRLNLDAVLDMEAAATDWVKADGKLFLPPSGASGTGEGNQNRGNGGGQNGAPVNLADLGGGSAILSALANARG